MRAATGCSEGTAPSCKNCHCAISEHSSQTTCDPFATHPLLLCRRPAVPGSRIDRYATPLLCAQPPIFLGESPNLELALTLEHIYRRMSAKLPLMAGIISRQLSQRPWRNSRWVRLFYSGWAKRKIKIPLRPPPISGWKANGWDVIICGHVFTDAAR